MADDPILRLYRRVAARRGADPKRSYTAKLFAAGTLKCAKKVGEEGVEVALAGVAEDKRALAEESADLLYHLVTLWAAAGIAPRDVYAVLKTREGKPGRRAKAKPGNPPLNRPKRTSG